MARSGRNRGTSGVLPGLTVGVVAAPAHRPPVPARPPAAARRAGPAAGRSPGLSEPGPELGAEPLRGLADWLLVAGVVVTVGVIGLGFWQGVRLLLRPDPDAATTATAVAMVLASTCLPPGIAWVAYRRMRPPPRTSPWQGGVLAADPATQAELLASPAGAIGAAVLALGCFVVLVVVAVLAAPLAWVGAVPASVLAALLARRMLRPTVLVVNARGFGVRARRWEDRFAMPWSDVAEVTRGTGDLVLVATTPGPDGAPRPGIQLRRAGPAGADQLAELLTSYLAATVRRTRAHDRRRFARPGPANRRRSWRRAGSRR